MNSINEVANAVTNFINWTDLFYSLIIGGVIGILMAELYIKFDHKINQKLD